MTRKKITLARIENDSARKTTLRKRRLGLIKKVSELTTLCGTRACLVIYSPGENEPVVWPSHGEVRRQLREYENKPELEKMKKMMNQESYLNEMVSKAEEQLRKLRKRNQEVEMGDLMRRTELGKGSVELGKDKLLRLIWVVEEKMKEIRRRTDFLQQVPFQSSASSSSGRLHRVEPNAWIDGGVSEPGMWDQWFIDMINNNEPTFADMGQLPMPGHSLGGTVDMRVPLYGDFRGATADMGLPPPGFRPPRGGATSTGLPHGSIFGNGIGMGQQYPFGHIGTSCNVSEQGVAFWPFGGGGGGGGGTADNDAGMQFDGTSRPNNFYR